VQLGKGVEVGAYSVIGGAAEIKKQRQLRHGKVIIESKTIIREHVTIHSSRNRHGTTYIGKGCYIQAHAHIGHDCQIGDNVIIACYACVGGHTLINDHANLALHTVTHPRTYIKEGTILGCNSFAKGILEPWSVYVGSPAKRIKANNHLRRKLGLNEI
jgi:UDP-N-acetylglucosamine acyltransferase